MIDLIDLKKPLISIDKIEDELFIKKNISVSILRLDKIDPVISGNKIFKLHYFLEEAVNSKDKKIITFGGAFSNHLAATAAACNALKLSSVGIVRGEEPVKLSNTLLFCKEQNMQLKFISRNDYSKKTEDDFFANLQKEFGDHTLIPEGGFGSEGVKGAEKISQYYDNENYTNICLPVGTGTTLAAIINTTDKNNLVIGFSALKNVEINIKHLLIKKIQNNYIVNNDYHGGGYAKKNNELIYFMNKFYRDHKIPTDFVYTGKMMQGIFDLSGKNYFPDNSKILCIHTGGLQGNLSLPNGMLNF